jgi:hypothetical protein
MLRLYALRELSQLFKTVLKICVASNFQELCSISDKRGNNLPSNTHLRPKFQLQKKSGL